MPASQWRISAAPVLIFMKKAGRRCSVIPANIKTT
uniref:Uncharacterized protein n=1 Tax=Siphoviridae sp. ctcC24 TaxID=2825570 RepID=A0A8S5Q2H7_9CAUD|nr:MAG TPA: hypothetical protein [Siphoviridae sp. ctcC24]